MIFDLPWQELVFTVGGFVFFIALLPSIFSKNKPAFITSLVTASFLSLFVLAFATLDLWWSAGAQALGALAWWILAVQSWFIPIRYRYSYRA
jgi:hypothetical protein